MERKPNKNQVNKVRKKAEQEISFGRGLSVPEDEVKKSRQKGAQLELKGKHKIALPEQKEIGKGRAPKQEKPKSTYDRHAPRRSEVEKAYTKEAQKLRNKLRYREKQGFYVKWETLPSRPSRITQKDIDRLNQYAVQLNELGEIEVKRFEYDKPARLIIPKENRPNYDIKNDPNFVPPMESVQHFEIFDAVETRLLKNQSILQGSGVQLNHDVRPEQEGKWLEISSFAEDTYQQALDIFRSQRDSPLRQAYADYLASHEYEVMEAIDIVLEASDQPQQQEARSNLISILTTH